MRVLVAGATGFLGGNIVRAPQYRQSLFKGIDVVCHAGTWGFLRGHVAEETRNFYGPTCDLMDQAIRCGVRRFILTTTMMIAPPPQDGEALDDFAPPLHTGFWPHLDRLVDLDDFMRRNCNRRTEMIATRLGHFE